MTIQDHLRMVAVDLLETQGRVLVVMVLQEPLQLLADFLFLGTEYQAHQALMGLAAAAVAAAVARAQPWDSLMAVVAAAAAALAVHQATVEVVDMGTALLSAHIFIAMGATEISTTALFRREPI